MWLFAVGSLRDFPESLAEGIDIPLCASGPQPRQFGGVCLTYEQRHHAFIHTLIITCQTSVTNIPARAAACGRRGQNVGYIPAVWQRPTSGHVRPPSKHVPVVSSCCRFERPARARSLSLSLKPSARETICCFVPMVAFLLPPSLLEGKGMICGVHGRGPC